MTLNPSFAAAAVVAMAFVAAVHSTPRIAGVSGVALSPKPTPQAITVSGEGFMNGLSLTITTPDGANEVFKDIPVQSKENAVVRVQATLPVPGVYVFVTTNTDGGVSQPFRFELKSAGLAARAAAPVIDAITPATVNKQSQPQVLTIDGKRFLQGLIVTLNDAAGHATSVSGNAISHLTENSFAMTVLISVEGEYTVSITNPDGQVSNSASLSVRGTTSPKPQPTSPPRL